MGLSFTRLTDFVSKITAQTINELQQALESHDTAITSLTPSVDGMVRGKAGASFVDLPLIYASAYGADAAAIRTAITIAQVRGVNAIYLAGTFTTDGTTISVPSNFTILTAGAGKTMITVPAGVSLPLFDLDGVSTVRIGGFTATVASGAAATGTADAVRVRGAASNILIEGGVYKGFVLGVQIAGGLGTIPDTCRRITVRDTETYNSPSLSGFNVDDADDVLFDRCTADGHWLDGFKLRKKAFNVTVRDCRGTNNGRSTTSAGDGLDAYAGGETLVIDGGIWESNGVGATGGNGITIKTDWLSRDDPTNYGLPRNIQIRGVRARNNKGSGVGVYSFDSPSDSGTTTPLLAHVIIDGGQYEGNTNHGLMVGGRNVVIHKPIVRKNGLHGIYLTTRSLHTTIRDPVVLANSQTTPGSNHGIYVQGTHILIEGGTVLGVDADTILTEADYAGLTKYHKANVYVAASADDVVIRDVAQGYSTDAQGIQTWGDITKRQVVHTFGAGTPQTANGSLGTFGGVGSTWQRTDSTGGDVTYVKAVGAPNTPTAGWIKRQIGAGPFGYTLDFPSIPAGGSTFLTCAFSSSYGVVAGDVVIATPPNNWPMGLVVYAWAGTNQAIITVYNATAAAIDPPSGSWRVATIRT